MIMRRSAYGRRHCLRCLDTLLTLCLLALMLLVSFCRASSSPSISEAARMESLGLYGIQPDPFIAASPVIVAAVCSDGIAMVAAHTVSKTEKLLREVEDERETRKGSFGWKDLQQGHGGPYRINRIDRSGTHLLSAGWRADCDFLAEKLRSVASKEVAIFGPPQWGLPYGRFLAQEASLWMAQLAVSEHFRPLSSVGLLAGCSDQDQHPGSTVGSLWFVDVTGAYRVRALAIGGGKAETGEEKDEHSLVAQLVNAQLMRTDFSTITAREGVVHILKILCGGDEENDSSSTPLVPVDCEMEIAITKATLEKIQRLNLSTLL